MASDVHTSASARDERGETLIEIILAISVLSIIAIAAFSGLTTATTVSAAQRTSARNETILRSAAEQLQNPALAYVPRAGCSGAGTYSLPSLPSTPSGYVVSIATVTFWTGASTTPSATAGVQFDSTCPASATADKGLQQVTLQVTTPQGTTDRLDVVKRRP